MNDDDAIAAAPRIGHDLPAMLTGMQVRMARAALRWSAQRLAAEAEVGIASVQRVDRVDGVPNVRAPVLGAIQTALERGGVVFLDPDEQKPGGPARIQVVVAMLA